MSWQVTRIIKHGRGMSWQVTRIIKHGVECLGKSLV